MKKLFLMLAALVAAMVLNVATAQTAKPVTWRMTVKMTNAKEGVVTIKATLQPGWHLYGTQLPAGGPKSTVFDMSKSTGVTFSSALTPARNPLKVQDEMFGMQLNWWDKDITFTRKFKVKNKAKAQINCTVSYMSCNNQTCSPPETITLSKTL